MLINEFIQLIRVQIIIKYSLLIYLAEQILIVPCLFEEKGRDLVFASPSFLPSFRPPPIEVGTLWVQIFLQFYIDFFETSLVFWTWSEDMPVYWI